VEELREEGKDVSLLSVPLFSEFEIAELRIISGFSSVRRYKKQQIIFLEGESYSGFYLVLKGKIKVYKISPDGRESIVHIVKPFDPFAEVPLFEQRTTYPVNAEALEESVLFFIPKDGFLQFIATHPQIYFKIITGFAKKLRELTNRLESITLNEVTTRLSQYLLDEIPEEQRGAGVIPSVVLTFTKSALAVYLGTAIETLSRTFKKLQDAGIIEVRGNTIVISDISKLKALAS
jgi:CRP/FNR family transcriptional regulator